MLDKIANFLETLVLIMCGIIALGIFGGMTYGLYNHFDILGGMSGAVISGAAIWLSVYVGKRM